MTSLLDKLYTRQLQNLIDRLPNGTPVYFDKYLQCWLAMTPFHDDYYAFVIADGHITPKKD